MCNPTDTETQAYIPTEQTKQRIENNFTYHPPKTDQAQRYNNIRTLAHDVADLLTHLCPESRELSLALTHLEESVMWANAAIARNE